MKWKFWQRKQEPVYSVDPGMYLRLRHLCANGASGLDLVGKTPEEQADEFNQTTAAEVFFEKKGIVVSPDDIRAAQPKDILKPQEK